MTNKVELKRFIVLHDMGYQTYNTMQEIKEDFTPTFVDTSTQIKLMVKQHDNSYIVTNIAITVEELLNIINVMIDVFN